ncbi:cyclic pyranopterin monophosphate synthase MoaC [Acidaminobacter sp.]|uniref:cyclic pyranopterin monophosphate synthase MoaC n=1 Tax=Acidaminobacter sp. TaxID=1872102 RepID=UPI0025624F3D|nr:cyclic pyranopterin monophosphate synthase MoaC [Acidaminobacter sp.]
MLTHINESGRAKMVDVGEKDETLRIATARGRVTMLPETFERIMNGGVKKGDVLAVAQVAGIMGAKRTSDLVPMCHPIFLTGVDMSFTPNEAQSAIEIEAVAKTIGRTGVEMEALSAVTTAALTIYDMVKAMDRTMVIEDIRLVQKSGGKSGDFVLAEE